MGANRVRLELTDGRTFDNVMVAGGRFVKVLCQNEILFDASDVVAATDFTNAPPRPPSRTSQAQAANRASAANLAAVSPGSRALGTAMRCATTRDKHAAVERCSVQYPGLAQRSG
jgi:hypothetical protein